MARKKRLNKNLVVGLTFLGFIIVTGTGLLLVMQFRTTDPSLLEEKGYACLTADPPEYENALTYYVRAYSVSGNDPKYLSVIGDIYWDMGETQKAFGVWRKAAVEDPENAETQEKLLSAILEIVDMQERQGYLPQVNWRQVLEPGGNVLRLDPDNPQALYAMGTALKAIDSVNAIDSELTQAWQEQDVSSLDPLKKALGALGDAIGADEVDTSENWAEVVGSIALEKACEQEPLNVTYINRLASFLFDSSSKERSEEAEKLWLDQIEAFGDAKGVDPSMTRLNYARYLASREDDDEAIKWYEDAIRAAGDDREAKAEAYAQVGNYWTVRWAKTVSGKGDERKWNSDYRTKAIELLDKAIAEDPGAFFPYRSLMKIYEISGEQGEALLAIERRLGILDDYSIDRESFKRNKEKYDLFTMLIEAAEKRIYLAEQLQRLASKLKGTELDEKDKEFLSQPGVEIKTYDANTILAASTQFLQDAVDDIDQADHEIENRPITLEMKAAICQVEGDFEKAVELRRQSKELRGAAASNSEPQQTMQNQFVLAQLLLQLKRYGAAKNELTEICTGPFASEINNPNLWFLYATCLQETGEHDAALLAIGKAEKRAPGDARFLRYKATILSSLGDAEGAKAILARLEQEGGVFGEEAARRLLANDVQGLLKSGDKSGAVDKAREAYEKDSDVSYLVFYAEVLNRVGEAGQACNVIQEFLDKHPDSPVRETLQAKLIQYDGSLSKEEKEKRLADLRKTQIKGMSDSFEQNLAYAQLYLAEATELILTSQNQAPERAKETRAQANIKYEKADGHFAEAQKTLENGTTASARREGKTTLLGILGDRLKLALQTHNWDRADEITKTVMTLAEGENPKADDLDVKTFVGRVQMARGLASLQKARGLYSNGDKEQGRIEQERAREYLEGAVLSLGPVADQQQTNVEILSDLAKCYYFLQDHLETRNTLSRVIDIDPRNGWAYRTLAELAKNAGQDDQFKNYVEHASQLLPNDPWVKEQEAQLEEQDKPEEGIVRREAIRKEKPDDVTNLVKLAALYSNPQIDRIQEARECYDHALEVAKGNDQYDYGTLMNLAANFYRNIGDAATGIDLLENYANTLDDSEERALMFIRIGRYLVSIRELEQADEKAREAADLSQTRRVCMNLAIYYADRNQVDDALQWIRKAIDETSLDDSSQLSTLKRLEIDYLLKANERDLARKKMDEYHERFPDDLYGLLTEALVSRSFGNVENAIESLSSFIASRPDANQVRFMRAQLLVTLGEWVRAIQDLEAIRGKDPAALNFQPRILLSKAYHNTGRSSQGVHELQNVLGEYPEADHVALALVNLFVLQENLPDAERIVAIRLNRDPDSSQWLQVAGEISQLMYDQLQEKKGELLEGVRSTKKEEDLAKVEKELASYARKVIHYYHDACLHSDYSPVIDRYFLDACIRYKDVRAATQFFQQDLPAEKRSPELMYRYAHILAIDNKDQDAANLYLAAIDQQAFLSIDFLRRVTVDAIAAFGLEKAEELFSKHPKDQRLQYARDILYSTLLEVQQDVPGALGMIDDLLTSAKTSQEKALWLVRKASLLSQSGKPLEAQKYYEQSLEVEGDSFVALNNLAYLLTNDLDQPEQALAYAKKAVELNPQPLILDTLGWVYVKLGQYQDAIGVLTQALSIEPENMDAMIHLAEAYRLSSNFETASKILDTAMKVAKDRNLTSVVSDIDAIQKKVSERNSQPD